MDRSDEIYNEKYKITPRIARPKIELTVSPVPGLSFSHCLIKPPSSNSIITMKPMMITPYKIHFAVVLSPKASGANDSTNKIIRPPMAAPTVIEITVAVSNEPKPNW